MGEKSGEQQLEGAVSDSQKSQSVSPTSLGENSTSQMRQCDCSSLHEPSRRKIRPPI
jgi:hypothetical protein